MIVYLFRNTINGKGYVGKHGGQNLDKYWKVQVRLALQGQTKKRALYAAIRKYGADVFTRIILCSPQTERALNKAEQFYIQKLQTKAPTGYNLSDGGEGVLHPSAETRKKMSIAKKQWWIKNDSPQVRANFSRAHASQLRQLLTHEHQVTAARAAGRIAVKTGQIQELGRSGVGAHKAKEAGVGIFGMTHKQHQNAGKMRAHRRWHVARGLSNPKCKLCRKKKS